MGSTTPSLDEWQRGGKFFDHRGHQIFYRTSPATESKQRLLLIHGFPTASWDWAQIWEPLARHFELITLDMIGFGLSAKPTDFAYSIKAQADLMGALLKHLGVSRCHLLAHDYGNTVAQELLARHIARNIDNSDALTLDSVCFLNGGLFPEAHRPLLIQKLLLSPLGPLVARFSNRRSFAASMRRIFGPHTQPSATELDTFWRLVTHNHGMRIMPKHIRYMVERRQNRERWVGAIVNSPVRLRLIDGMLDPISGAHLVARYRELVPRPDVVPLERVGHYPQVEAPAEVLAGVLQFHGL